jgi:hypothetical protein
MHLGGATGVPEGSAIHARESRSRELEQHFAGRLDRRTVFAIRAARPFDMPLRLSALYFFLFFTEFPAIETSS